ncbi:MAG: TetR/AcrR family transcriptional regulator [Novosphingobium sp.]|nr:TetR/AcrR family transcriptional regulator [Novosphingobium sp.]
MKGSNRRHRPVKQPRPAPCRRAQKDGRRRRSAEEIRDKLLRAAREEFAARSFAGARTAAIARRADVAEIQMFRYFPSKADLFHEAIFAPLIEHFRAFNAQHGKHSLDEPGARKHAAIYITELQAFLEKQARSMISLLVAQLYEGRSIGSTRLGIAELQAYFSESARCMSQRSRTSARVDPDKLVRVAFGTLLGCLTYRDWLFPDASSEREQIDEAIRAFILQGVGPLVGPMADDGQSQRTRA